MAEKKSNLEEAPEAAPVATTEVTPASAPTAKSKGNGVAVAAIVVGSVLVAGALFGGGVLVGTNLDERNLGMSDVADGHSPLPGPGNHPGAGNHPGPHPGDRPGDSDGDIDGDRD